MNRTTRLTLTLIIGLVTSPLLWTGDAHAQDIGGAFFRDDAARNRVVLAAGWDAAPASWLGYGRAISLGARDLLLHASLGGSVFLLSEGDSFKARVGASTFLVGGPLDVKVTLVLHGQTLDHSLASGSSYGWEATVSPGWYGDRWSLGLDFTYRQATLTHLEHSPEYREQFMDARDGWYHNTGGYYFGTITAATLIANSVELALRGGVRVPEHFDMVSPYVLPYSLTLSSAYRF